MTIARVDATFLNQLRDRVNDTFGLLNGRPRINLGPCGRFARLFHDLWNARFDNKVCIAFLMSSAGDCCYHVLIRLPDGRYYDGGNGLMSSADVRRLHVGGRVEDMESFDLALLDDRAYGLTREYPACPNYSDEIAAELIAAHLVSLDTTAVPRSRSPLDE